MNEPDLAAALRAHMGTLPFLTADVPPVSGELKRAPEDFVVEELPAYLPSGSGEHLYLWIEKRGLNTPDAVRGLCTALGARFENAGWAGLKDRQAITRQWVSLQHAATPEAASLEVPGVRVLEVSRHGNKLRTGHLRGNRFSLRLAGVDPADDARVKLVLDRLVAEGLPNYFGAQRFGFEGKNILSAHNWLVRGSRGPDKPFLRKLFVSSLQGALFNAWLGERLARGLFTRALQGDLLRKEDSGGVFLCDDPARDQPRIEAWEISPTGPMFGVDMRSPEAEALALETEVASRWGVDRSCFERAKKVAEGTRRPARVRPEGVSVRREDGDLVLEFGLPKGAYATVLVGEITKSRGVALAEDA